MTIAAAFTAIRTRCEAEIVAALSVPVQYENIPFTQPEDSEWIQLTIRPNPTSRVSLGATSTYRSNGIAIFSVFVPVKSGSARLEELADSITSAFRSVRASSVVFQTPSLGKSGRAGSFFKWNVTCPFYYDDTVTV